MSEKRGPGRPQHKNLRKAVAMIKASDEPISTSEIVQTLGLEEHEAIVLRRGLKTAERNGEIKQLIRDPAGSYTWVANECSLVKCAAHAANLYLKRADTRMRVDPTTMELVLDREEVN